MSSRSRRAWFSCARSPVELEQPPPVMSRLDDLRSQAQPVTLVGPQQLDLLRVEPELVQPAQPLARGGTARPSRRPPRASARSTVVRTLVSPARRARMLRRCRRRAARRRGSRARARGRASLAVGELLVQLGRLRVDEVRRELARRRAGRACSRASSRPRRTRPGAAARAAPRTRRAGGQRRREHGPRQHEPVRERVVEVARQQHRLVARAALADDADRLDRRQPELGERAQQPVLALREARRQLLQRVSAPS